MYIFHKGLLFLREWPGLQNRGRYIHFEFRNVATDPIPIYKFTLYRDVIYE